ncbi:MAG TPA: hypothetical protein VGN16_15525 [Acidobacteriaceae bacterium]|jgi:hypothetical protein
MLTADISEVVSTELSPDAIREQLELLVQDPVFRSSKRSVQFLRYVVEQTLQGSADLIKERTIGIEVFGRDPGYDTNLDHVVRTAAIELRKRLAIYYGEEKHRSELRMSLVPGSYIPRFTAAIPVGLPELPPLAEQEAAKSAHHGEEVHAAGSGTHAATDLPHADTTASTLSHTWKLATIAALLVLAAAGIAGYSWSHQRTAQDLFWKPVLDTPGSVLLAVGDVPDGPPTASLTGGNPADSVPVIHKTSSPTVPFADAVTFARVMGILASHGKKIVIRRESASSFSELREGPVVLIGAFNNEWSLRLTQQLRYTLALDPAQHVIYIRDAKAPNSRSWSWQTDRPTAHQGEANGPPLQDYALISRIWNSETGHVVIVIGGLYTYGTEAAGEFLTDPQLMQAITSAAPLDDAHSNLQIVLGTKVTDGTAGPPKVLAVSTD